MPPITLMVKPVSGRCNMRCRYCFYADELHYRGEAALPAMPLPVLEAAVRRVLRSAQQSAHFLFQGGEPTLAGLPFFQAAVAAQRRYNGAGLQITNAVQTNGLHLSDEMVAFFAREKFLVGVSLDGTALTHDMYRADLQGKGTWARVRENLERLRRAGVACNVLCVVTQAVACRGEEVFDCLSPFQWLQFIPCLDPMNGKTQDHSLTSDMYASFLCKTFDRYEAAWQRGAPVSVRNFDNWIGMLMGRPPENCAMVGHCGNSLMLESDGTLYPCDFYGTDEWRLGNITETPYLKILQSSHLRRFVDASRPVPDKCERCAWYALCRNGCMRERNEITQVNRWCEAYQLFFAYAAPRMRRMAACLAKRPLENQGGDA